MNEIWKPINGYEDYLVSNMGRVRSMNPYNNAKPHLLSLVDHGDGYLYVSIQKNMVRKNFYVHRLVAEAFCLKPDGCDYVDHIDHDRANNKATNLEWVTQKENILRSVHLMRGPRDNGQTTSTGEKYVGFRNGRYRLRCKRWGVDRTYGTLEEAISERDRFSEVYDARQM
jgi:hypothetical protein